MRLFKSSFSVAALLLISGCANGFLNPYGPTTQPLPPGTMMNIVLVHGAWADGSSWEKVIPLLQHKGYHVTAVQNPLTSLADDVAATKRVLAVQDGPVLLVGHSYGGAVITEAGNDPKVHGLVYVAAFAPDEGKSAFDEAAAYSLPSGKDAQPDASGFLRLSAEGVARDFAPDLTSTEQATIAATQGWTSVSALTGKITTAAWSKKPTWYIVAGNDRMISPILERAFAKKMTADTIEISASHVVMLSHPEEVAKFIEKAATAAAIK